MTHGVTFCYIIFTLYYLNKCELLLIYVLLIIGTITYLFIFL